MSVGWTMECTNGNKKLFLSVSSINGLQKWQLDICPYVIGEEPGFIDRLFGKKDNRKRSAEPKDNYDLSSLVHEIIIKIGFTPKCWCWGEGHLEWDDYGKHDNSNNEPQLPS